MLNVRSPGIFARRVGVVSAPTAPYCGGETQMDMFEVVIEKPAPRQEPPAPEPLALPTVLKRDDLRVNERNSLRKLLRRISRRRARQLWDLALHVPGFIAFGAGPVPRELLLHHWLELMDLAVHLPGLVVLGVRIRLAGFGCVARSQPIVVFKYLGQYLANSFDTSTRLRIMSHHYRTLAARLPNLGKLGFPANELALWSHRVELDTFTIGLCIPNYYYWSMEGDLSLVFSVNGVRVHRLSFTCIPGKEAGLETGTALLVGGSQGFAGTSTLVRQAS